MEGVFQESKTCHLWATIGSPNFPSGLQSLGCCLKGRKAAEYQGTLRVQRKSADIWESARSVAGLINLEPGCLCFKNLQKRLSYNG